MRFLAFILLLLSFGMTVHSQTKRQDSLLEKNWRFSKGDFSGAEQVNFSDKDWEACLVLRWVDNKKPPEI